MPSIHFLKTVKFVMLADVLEKVINKEKVDDIDLAVNLKPRRCL